MSMMQAKDANGRHALKGFRYFWAGTGSSGGGRVAVEDTASPGESKQVACALFSYHSVYTLPVLLGKG